MEKKTKVIYIYAYFSEWDTTGHSYSCFESKVGEDAIYKFLCEIEVPILPQEDVVKMGVAKIDGEIGDLMAKITERKEKKQQLLAIEFKGDD